MAIFIGIYQPRFSKMEKLALKIICYICFLLAVGATNASIDLYDGQGNPSGSGWIPLGPFGCTSGDPCTWSITNLHNGSTNFATAGSADRLYSYDTGESNLMASIRLKVNSSSWNHADAGLLFSLWNSGSMPPFPAGIYFPYAERINSLSILPDMIRWGDDDGTFYSLDATQYHEYILRYSNQNLFVYVDESYQDILSGAASPVLFRLGVEPSENATMGKILFGDNTNDLGVNSNFDVDYVRFQAIPLPTAAWLFLSAISALYTAKRKFS